MLSGIDYDIVKSETRIRRDADGNTYVEMFWLVMPRIQEIEITIGALPRLPEVVENPSFPEVVEDPMVPEGHFELRDPNSGDLLRRQPFPR